MLERERVMMEQVVYYILRLPLNNDTEAGLAMAKKKGWAKKRGGKQDWGKESEANMER